jgi:hypothetical protein
VGGASTGTSSPRRGINSTMRMRLKVDKVARYRDKSWVPVSTDRVRGRSRLGTMEMMIRMGGVVLIDISMRCLGGKAERGEVYVDGWASERAGICVRSYMYTLPISNTN